jgi:hypothetical protein
MQFLLSEEEYNQLKNKRIELQERDKKKLQAFCTMVANSLPVKFRGRKEAEIWGCIRNKEDDNHNLPASCGYCDQCPSVEICPYDQKDFSK